MPKLKTHQGMAKRVKLTGRGKLLRRKAYRSHLLGHKQAATKRTYVKEYEIVGGDANIIKRMIGR